MILDTRYWNIDRVCSSCVSFLGLCPFKATGLRSRPSRNESDCASFWLLELEDENEEENRKANERMRTRMREREREQTTERKRERERERA